jgi:outer membrane lipoprotein SlyB
MTFMIRAVLAALVAVTLAAPAAAQQSVTQADIQRLQDNVFQAERDLNQMSNRDSARVARMRDELDDLRDEVIYLKVKLRKDRNVTRAEYADVRDRIEDLRSSARGVTRDSAAPSAPPAAAPAPAPAPPPARAQTTASPNEVPAGTELDVRLQNSLNSGTAKVEDRFEGTTLVDLNVNGRVLIPAGSVMRGVLTSVEPATRTNRTAKMTVSFDQVTVNGRSYPMRGTVTQAIEGEGIRGETARAGAGAAVGGIIGAVLGGVKGALLGVLIGGGGTIAATEGKEVDLPQGTVLRVRVDSPLQIQNPR